MNTDNLKKVLSVVRDLIKRNRVAYKDYLGEETITETKVFAKGTFAENGAGLTCDDPTITSFVTGETYQITIDGETTDYVAITEENIILVGNVTDGTKPLFAIGFVSGNVRWEGDESLIGKTVSVSQTKTVTHKNYDIKKLPEELLPDEVNEDRKEIWSRLTQTVSIEPQKMSIEQAEQARKNIGAIQSWYELQDKPFYKISSNRYESTNFGFGLVSNKVYKYGFSTSAKMVNGIDNILYSLGCSIPKSLEAPFLRASRISVVLTNNKNYYIEYVGNPYFLTQIKSDLHTLFGFPEEVKEISSDIAYIDNGLRVCWACYGNRSDGTYANYVFSTQPDKYYLDTINVKVTLEDGMLPDTVARTYGQDAIPKISIHGVDEGKILQVKSGIWALEAAPKDYFASTDALPQHAMSANPTEDMQIATKKYVDSKEFISSSTEGSTKKFKITVDDTGTITATEVTEPST